MSFAEKIKSQVEKKNYLEELGPIQGPQETSAQREARELRTALAQMTDEHRKKAVDSWKGVADSLPSDYN